VSVLAPTGRGRLGGIVLRVLLAIVVLFAALPAFGIALLWFWGRLGSE
jgi:hypothetical protein